MKTRQPQSPNPPFTGPLIFIAALVARLGALGRYTTPDELAWVQRSINMRAALLSADWSNTIQAGHPGVVTTWLGAIGVQITLWLNPSTNQSLEFIRNLAWINPVSGEAHQHLAQFLTGGRFMIALATAAGIWFIYTLCATRYHPTATLLAAVFLALDPWTAGLSGLLHVDAILATFILITLLLVLDNGRLSAYQLLLAGGCTAAALLNKIPGAILLGIVPAVLLTRQLIRLPSVSFNIVTKRFIVELGWWLLGILITSALLLPALWAAPSTVIETLITDTTRITGKRAPIFFLGSPSFDIGPHFYPLAILIRQSPLVTLGLGLLGWQVTRRTIGRKHAIFGGVLIVFCLLFWAGITLSSREFVRYALPISMILTFVGGLAAGKFISTQKKPLLYLILLLQFCWMAWFWQFPLSTANLVTGGPWASINQVGLGWGDGVSQAAKVAAAQPNITDRRLFTSNVPAAAPYYPGEVLLLDDQTINLLRPDDFLILPIGEKQANPGRWQSNGKIELAPLSERFPSDLPPIHTVRFNQLDRAWLYTGLPDQLLSTADIVTQNQPIRIGDSLTLTESKIFVPQNSHHLIVQTTWRSSPGQEYRIKLMVKDAQGNLWITREEPLVSNSGLPASAWSADKSEQLFLKLPLPADLPPSNYKTEAEMFDHSGNRLGQFGADGNFLGTSAGLGIIQSAAPIPQPLIAADNSDQTTLPLIGFTQPPSSVGQGETVRFDVWLKSNGSESGSQRLNLHIGDELLTLPIETTGWLPGQTYRIKGSWSVPVDMPVGAWPLSVHLTGEQSAADSDPLRLGSITVEERQRTFDLPSGLQPIGIQFGSVGLLQQAEITITDQLQLEIIWQANEPDTTSLTMFVHLRDGAGNVVGQLDRPPIKPTSLWVPGEIISDTIVLDWVDGSEQVAIGLYDPSSGQRLPVFTPDGLPLDNQQAIVNIIRK